jgi:hypothetical protein
MLTSGFVGLCGFIFKVPHELPLYFERSMGGSACCLK